MSKFKTDLERLEAVKEFKLSGKTLREFADSHNIPRTTLSDWVNAYNNLDGSFVRINKVLDKPEVVLENEDITMKMLSTEDILKKSTHFTRFDHSVVVIEIGRIKITTSIEQSLKILERYYARFE